MYQCFIDLKKGGAWLIPVILCDSFENGFDISRASHRSQFLGNEISTSLSWTGFQSHDRKKTNRFCQSFLFAHELNLSRLNSS